MQNRKRPFATNLKIERTSKRLTQAELSALMEEKVFNIQAWEDDRAQPNFTKLAKLTKVLEIENVVNFISEYQ